MTTNTLERAKSNFDSFFATWNEQLNGVKDWRKALKIAANLYAETFETDGEFPAVRFGDDEDKTHLSGGNPDLDNDGVVAARIVTRLHALGMPDTPQVRAQIRLLCQQVDALLKDHAPRAAIQGSVTVTVAYIDQQLVAA